MIIIICAFLNNNEFWYTVAHHDILQANSNLVILIVFDVQFKFYHSLYLANKKYYIVGYCSIYM